MNDDEKPGRHVLVSFGWFGRLPAQSGVEVVLAGKDGRHVAAFRAMSVLHPPDCVAQEHRQAGNHPQMAASRAFGVDGRSVLVLQHIMLHILLHHVFGTTCIHVMFSIC